MLSRAVLSAFAAMSFAFSANAAEGEGEFKSLFNGKDLTGWAGEEKLWKVEDGAIVGQTTKEVPTKGNTFLVYTPSEFKDFEFKCKFKLENTKNNSGVQYRSKEAGSKFVLTGYQYDIQAGFPNMAKLYHEKNPRGRIAMGGEVVEIGADSKKNVKGVTPDIEKLKLADKGDEWHDCEIIAKGNHVIHKVDGVVSIDLTDNDEKNAPLSGILGLQIHAGAPMTIRFKDIQIKELKD